MTPKRPVVNPHCQPSAPHDLIQHRAQFLHTIRQFFDQRGFLEVETPVLIPVADPSPHLDSFVSHYQVNGQAPRPLFLRTSPEFAMKRLVALGYERLYQICKFFRNGEVSPMHNPEFTGLEWYATEADYDLLMTLTEEMILALTGSDTLTYQGETVDLKLPWERLSVNDAIERHTDLSLPQESRREDLADACRSLSLTVQEDDQWDDLFFKIFLTFVEPHMGKGRPTFLMDYPIQLAALARPKPGAPFLAERVELYIAGVELANGYSELIDPQEQERRWLEEGAYRRERGDALPYPPDPALINALAWGMPPTAGIALGLDRLLMLLRDAPSIDDVLPFPLSEYPD